MNRRQFLASSTAAFAVTGSAIAGPRAAELRAAVAQVQIAPPGYGPTDVWAFNGQIPGQELRVRQGEMLKLRYVNDLPQPSTVHWHGIRLPNAMDGASGLTQDAVQPGEAFNYEFIAPDAGTFWYHPHHNSIEQVSRGLSGALIVEEPDAPDADADLVLVLDDWRMTQQAQIDTNFDASMDFSHGGRLGNYVTVNGTNDHQISAKAGDRLRLRLINTATDRIFNLQPMGMKLWLVALDGMPITEPTEIKDIVLAPAQRVDVMADVTASAGDPAYLASVERTEGYIVSTVNVSAGTTTPRTAAPKPLPPNDVTLPDIAAAQSAPLLMEGGAMRGMSGAIYKGEQASMRTLMSEGQFWSFNGVAGMADTPLVKAALGQSIRIPIKNDTVFAHAMHLHGHHFREVRADNSFGPLRDTILVNPDETREIAFVADNSGKWMFHCHMLAHQKAGMTSWIDVVA